ncbi:beta-glucosidase 11 [Quercus suber]|uniref:Beta-glucosidase 11 n=1 Tax=Quercus suber TaxID=58331 RepID=A0AAW0KWI0_QUESU
MLSKHCFGKKMLILSYFFLFLLINISVTEVLGVDKFSRDDFPPDFVFGSGTSAYQDDVQLMVDTGLEAYRFSISWSRLIPRIQPHVTLHHSDFPQALEDKYGGWLSRKMVKDFTAYADVCFRNFGDRVLHWTTMNEANVFTIGSYNGGYLPPGHCSSPFGINCTRGNSSTEPYLATHHILLAHASAARLYKEKYQDQQHGFIGINLFAFWLHPLTNKTKDVIATQRAKDFLIGSRLPAFTNLESNLVKGSFDFLGLNYYAMLYIKDDSSKLNMEVRDFDADMAIDLSAIQNDTSVNEIPTTPWALQELLEYFKQAYGNPPIYIHENGQRTRRNSSLEDEPRVNYLHGHIGALLDALRNGSNTRGYFQWAFLDVLELLDGYESSFGLYYIDLDDPDLKRQPKLSAHWYSHFLKTKGVSSDGFIKLEKNLTAFSHAHFSRRKMLRLVLLTSLAALVLSTDKFSRDDFPPDFVFGAAASAYQVEGAANLEGRHPAYGIHLPMSLIGPTHISGNMHGTNGDIACDEYHKYKHNQLTVENTPYMYDYIHLTLQEDVQLMEDTDGRGAVNPKGLQYYNKLINELISHGIQPHVTLHHTDLPQALEDEYGGWVSRKIVKDFTTYANVCFKKFGDRISYWTTINEANVFVLEGYDTGFLPPQRCSPLYGGNCSIGNSSTEPIQLHPGVCKESWSISSNFMGTLLFTFMKMVNEQDVIQHWKIGLGNGSNTRGYFTWSFLDLFEMLDGYESSYGLYFVDLDDPDLKRQPKLSAHCI